MSSMLQCRTSNTITSLTTTQCKVKPIGVVCCSVKKNNCYKVLSLEGSENVGAEEIKRAYRRLALKCHPDVCPPSQRAESTALFLELRLAYETLSDQTLRARHDAELTRVRLHHSEAAARPPAPAGFARDVWEAQLCALRVRSERRQKARAGFRAPPR